MKNKLIIEQFRNGYGEVGDWDQLDISTILKEELRHDAGKKHIIDSYLTATKELYNSLRKLNHPDYRMTLMRTDSLCIPFLFLCRHTIELSLKFYLGQNNKSYDNIHDIKLLYNLTSINNTKYDDLIDLFDELDNTGTKLRYSTDMKDNSYREKTQFINTKMVMNLVEDFSSFLIQI